MSLPCSSLNKVLCRFSLSLSMSTRICFRCWGNILRRSLQVEPIPWSPAKEKNRKNKGYEAGEGCSSRLNSTHRNVQTRQNNWKVTLIDFKSCKLVASQPVWTECADGLQQFLLHTFIKRSTWAEASFQSLWQGSRRSDSSAVTLSLPFH